MSVRNITTNQLVSGYVSNGWYNGRKSTTVRQRCNLTLGQQYFTLAYQLPPRARIVWGEMVNVSTVTAITGAGNDTNAVDAVALIMSPVTGTVSSPLTAPLTSTVAVSNLSGGANGFLVFQSGDLTTNASGGVRGVPQIRGTVATNVCANTATVNAIVSLMPMRATAGIGGTATNVATFGTAAATSTNPTTIAAGTVDVTLYVEEYDQAPYA